MFPILKTVFKALIILTLISCYYIGDDNSNKIIGKWRGTGTITNSKGITKPPEIQEIEFFKNGTVIQGGPNSLTSKSKFKIIGDTLFWFYLDDGSPKCKVHLDTLTKIRLSYKFDYSPVHIDYHFKRIR